MSKKITLADLSQHDIDLLALLVFRLKQEGIIGQTYEASDFIDVLLKRGDYESTKVIKETEI